MYCNPRQYCEEFGLSEATMLLQDESSDLTQHALNAVCRDDAVLLGDLSGYELTVAQGALARLVSALNFASNLMDGYLRGVLTLPLTQAQIDSTPLKHCCAELARCALMDDADNSTDLSEKRCDAQRKWLREINAGVVKLFADKSATSTSVGTTRHGVSPSLTDWRGYGV